MIYYLFHFHFSITTIILIRVSSFEMFQNGGGRVHQLRATRNSRGIHENSKCVIIFHFMFQCVRILSINTLLTFKKLTGVRCVESLLRDAGGGRVNGKGTRRETEREFGEILHHSSAFGEKIQVYR